MNMINHLFFLLQSLLAIATSAQVFVSIDCGSNNSDVYTDEIGISWSRDDTYIHTGENKVVQRPNSISQVMNTLRVFSTRKKNCYSINFTKGKKVLVRASFYYGNYDNKSSPPSFEIQLDGNYWATVDTSISKDWVIYVEAISFVRKDAISVCLAQTHPNQLPFISALEVRSLGYEMYRHVDSSYALFLSKRVAYGANETVRYPYDPYDRKWIMTAPNVKAHGLTVIASDVSEINTSDSPNNPPSRVLQNALTPVSTSMEILLGTGLPSREVSVYMNWYFSEVIELDSTQRRSFTIDIDDVPGDYHIVPSYGTVTEMNIVNLIASSNTKFTLVSTSDSTLPPLINALEVFVVSDILTNGTNSVDVEQLRLLQTHFDVVAEWSGDPCLPAPYTWDWVACSSDETPRITALYLSGFGLSGTLPNFSPMVALQTIDMQNNSLTGEIPDFLGDLPHLQELNLADNDFSGSVPTSVSKNKKLKLEVSGNQYLCISNSKLCKSSVPSTSGTSSDTATTPTSSGKTSSKIPIWVIILAFLAIIFIYHRRKTAALIHRKR